MPSSSAERATRMPPAVYIVGLSVFAIGTSEFMLSGPLPPIADDNVSIPGGRPAHLGLRDRHGRRRAAAGCHVLAAALQDHPGQTDHCVRPRPRPGRGSPAVRRHRRVEAPAGRARAAPRAYGGRKATGNACAGTAGSRRGRPPAAMRCSAPAQEGKETSTVYAWQLAWVARMLGVLCRVRGYVAPLRSGRHCMS